MDGALRILFVGFFYTFLFASYLCVSLMPSYRWLTIASILICGFLIRIGFEGGPRCYFSDHPHSSWLHGADKLSLLVFGAFSAGVLVRVLTLWLRGRNVGASIRTGIQAAGIILIYPCAIAANYVIAVATMCRALPQ
jgi:hypothetical protein